MKRPAKSSEALLGSILDYAGTFPPAELGVAEAMSSYASARASEHAWMLGRYVLPASQLREFERLAPAWLELPTHDPWPLSVILSGEPGDTEELARFSKTWQGKADIKALEFRPMEAHAIAEAVQRQPVRADMFFEVPLDSDVHERLSAVARAGACAKIRTGGVVAGSFPNVAPLARSLQWLASSGVAFKASAGLHHALRGHYALTYEQGSLVASMHGFINLSLAAALAHTGAPSADIERALSETAADSFTFDDQRLTWKGQMITTETLADVRTRFLRSFSSCSFDEPVSDLGQMGLV